MIQEELSCIAGAILILQLPSTLVSTLWQSPIMTVLQIVMSPHAMDYFHPISHQHEAEHCTQVQRHNQRSPQGPTLGTTHRTNSLSDCAESREKPHSNLNSEHLI